MLQGGGAWSGVRAMEMLDHVARLHAHPLDTAMLSERLGLADCGRTPYRRLSGGQQQRLGLAMAIVGRPEIVFVDEPTAGMDPQARRTTWELLEELRADGVTVVLTTHYMDEAERLADQIHIIDRGRLIASGTPEELTRGTSATVRLVVDQELPGAAEAALRASVDRWSAEHGVGVRSISFGSPHPRGRLPRAHRTGAGAMSTGTFTPKPGAAPLPRQVLAQSRMEARLMLRNGEQLLLAVVIPVLVLFGAVTAGEHLNLDLPSSRPLVDIFTPGVIALAVMSTSFTSLAIATGFERRYGVIKRLGSSPLPRSGLLAGKIGALLLVQLVQVVIIGGVGQLLGWTPEPGVLGVALAILFGTAAFASLGLFVAGALRAEATLAAANLIYLLLMTGGGVVLPLTAYGDARPFLQWLPSAALGEAMRTGFIDGGVAWRDLGVLLIWAVFGTVLTARTFKWE